MTLQAGTLCSKVAGMMDPKLIDDLARRLSNAVPTGLREAQQDLEKNFRTVLQNTLAKLDLVTREEFDVQTRLLARTRAKLEALEKTVTELESDARKD
jgi:BMFP domain-containing protein YqiC